MKERDVSQRSGLKAVEEKVGEAAHQRWRSETLQDWANIIAEFEDVARRVKALAEDCEDVELRYLSERLMQRAADRRQD